MTESLRDKDGKLLWCMHSGCWRPAVRIVAYESPNHRQFKGQSHDCCNYHSRPPKAKLMSFCEPSTATTLSAIHIREHVPPRRLGGGVDTLALCGKDLAGGWDLDNEVTLAAVRGSIGRNLNPQCLDCAVAYEKTVSSCG